MLLDAKVATNITHPKCNKSLKWSTPVKNPVLHSQPRQLDDSQIQQSPAPAPAKTPLIKPEIMQVMEDKQKQFKSTTNSISGGKGGILENRNPFSKFRKQSKFENAGTHFKYDYHPEEKLAMSNFLE